MSGRRRVQRSVRVTVATALVASSTALVAAAVAMSTALTAAAIWCVVASTAAARIMHAEVVATRLEAARGRAEQARAFGAALTTVYAEHSAFRVSITSRLAEREGTIRHAEMRVDEAEARASREASRADRETDDATQDAARA
ncbi:MAG: hypothetical protein H0V07_14095, partial [Propionibacteriales bacterium]|nr:hypothetical protein [Propionibacteriales bacterium]